MKKRVLYIQRHSNGFVLRDRMYLSARSFKMDYPVKRFYSSDYCRQARNRRKAIRQYRKRYPSIPVLLVPGETTYPSRRAAHEAACQRGDCSHTSWQGRLRQCHVPKKVHHKVNHDETGA